MNDDHFFIFVATALQRIVATVCVTILLWNSVPALETILTNWIAAAYAPGASQ
jgi:hypothetical protein